MKMGGLWIGTNALEGDGACQFLIGSIHVYRGQFRIWADIRWLYLNTTFIRLLGLGKVAKETVGKAEVKPDTRIVGINLYDTLIVRNGLIQAFAVHCDIAQTCLDSLFFVRSHDHSLRCQ